VPDPDPRRRFFISSEEDTSAPAAGRETGPPAFAAGRRLPLDATEAHHAARVLRLRAGDAVELFDGAGGTAQARLTEVRRGSVTAQVEVVRPRRERPAPILHAAFAVPKGRRLAWLLEKATELGAASLRPILFERSVAGGGELSPGQRRRWRSHCIAAAKQSGLDFLPAIEAPASLASYAAGPRTGLGLYGSLAEDARPLSAAVPGGGGERPVYYVVVGPEGGLTAGEREALRRGGFSPVSLGRSVLRTETAVVALISGILALHGQAFSGP